MERTNADVATHLASLEGRQGEEIRRLDASIRERMSDAKRHLYEGKMWGGTDQQIIGYGILDYTNRSGDDVEWFLVGLAAQKNYISMYVNAVKDGAYLLRDYEEKLGKVKVGSASISFVSIDDIDFDALMQLVAEAAATV